MKNPQKQQNFHVFYYYFEQKDSKICKFNIKKTFVKYVDYDFMAIMNQHPLAHHAYYYLVVDEC